MNLEIAQPLLIIRIMSRSQKPRTGNSQDELEGGTHHTLGRVQTPNLQFSQLQLFYPLRNLKNAGFKDATVIVPLKYKIDENIASKYPTDSRIQPRIQPKEFPRLEYSSSFIQY